MPTNANVPTQGAITQKSNIFTAIAGRIKGLFVVRAVGGFFYSIGFFTESVFIKLWRVFREGAYFLGQMMSWVFKSLWKNISKAFKSFWLDFIEPFKTIGKGFRQAKSDRSKAKNENEGVNTAAAQLGYLGSGVKGVASVIINVLRYLLPFAALAALIFTVNSLLGYRYALVVEMDGHHIGYISDEMVLQESINVVKGRIKASSGKTGDDWKPEGVTFRVSNVGSLTNKSQLINNMLEVYSELYHKDDALVVAAGLIIDGELYAATTDSQQLQIFLDSLLEAQNDPEHPEAKISFVKDVRIEVGENDYYYSSSIVPYDELIKDLSRVEYPAVYHVVQEGEDIESIALSNNLTSGQILARNSDIEFEIDENGGVVLVPGTKLVIQRDRYFLQVQKTMEVSYEEAVPFMVEEVETDKKVKGYKGKSQEGQEGLDLVCDSLVYVDGELVDRIRLAEKTQRILDPVNEIWEIGTRVYTPPATGSYNGGGGSYIWPVPDYTDVSRGWIPGVHKGLDITASAGTPIIASSSGEVILASWWVSYGNCVILRHSEGWETLYAHMSSINVSVGTVVNAGDVIGFVGSTGRSSGNHCHFEIRVNGQKTDPAQYVSRP